MKYAGRVVYDPYFSLSDEAADALAEKEQIQNRIGDVEDWTTIVDFMSEDDVVVYAQLFGPKGELKIFLKFDPDDMDQVNLFIPSDQADYPDFDEFNEAFFEEDEEVLQPVQETAETL